MKCSLSAGFWPPIHWSGALALCVFFAESSVSSSLLPFFVDELHIDSLWVSRAFTAQYMAGAIGQIVTGLLADKFGYRRTLALLMVANTVFLNLQGQVQSASGLILVRVLLGLVTPYALSLTWVAKASPASQLARNMSLAVLMAQISVSVGGLLAGQLDGDEFATACAVISVLPLGNSVLLFGARELAEASQETTTSKEVFRALSDTLRTTAFWAVAWCLFSQGSFLGFVENVPPLLLKEKLGMPGSVVSSVFVGGGLLTALCHAFLTPRIIGSFPALGAQVISVVLAGLMVAFGLSATSAVATCISTITAFAANFVCLACSNMLVVLVAKVYGPKGIAAVNGVARCVFTLGAAFSPTPASILQDAMGPCLPSLVLAVMFLLAAAILWCAGVSEKLSPPLCETKLSSAPSDQTPIDETIDREYQVPKKTRRNFNGTVLTRHYIYPQSQEDLIEEMQIIGGISKIAVVGAFSSFAFPQVVLETEETTPKDRGANQLTASDNVIVDMSSMNKVVSLDLDESCVTVEAGISWESLVHHLKEHGLALENLSAYTKVTVGGAAGTGTHGSGSSILANQFLSMQIVDARGELHTITDSRLFTHLGVLGIVSTITLRCVPLFYIKQSCYLFAKWSMLAHLFENQRLMIKVLEDNFSMMLRITIKDDGHPVLCFLRRAVDSMDDVSHDEAFLEAPLLRGSLGNTCYGGKPGTQETCFTACYDAVLADHSTMNTPSDAPIHYSQGEFFVPLADSLTAINALLQKASTSSGDLFSKVLPSGFKIRFVKSDDHYMSPCTNLASTSFFVAFQLSLYGTTAEVDLVLSQIEEGFRHASVTFTAHWGKCTHGGHAKINGHLKQQAKLFNDQRRALDPDNRFLWETSEVGKLLLD